MIRGLAVLAGAAVLVVALVAGLSEAILPDGPPATVSASPSTTLVSATGPPSEWGRNIVVSGDREGTVTVDQGDLRLTIAEDDGKIYVSQMVYEGLNIFLDPPDCPLEPEAISLESGLVRLRMSCRDITDVQGNHTIHLEGWTTHDARLVLPLPSDDTGGSLEISGDIEDVVPVPPMAWYVSSTGSPRAAMVAMDEPDPAEMVRFGSPLSLWLDPSGRPVVQWISVPGEDFMPPFHADPDECTVTDDVVAVIDENTERVEIGVQCPSLTSDDFATTISVSGTILADRFTLPTDD